MTPRQARAARAMLGLDMKTVCALAGIGKRTLTEFEAGSRAIYGATESKIKTLYISKGLSFTDQEGGESVGFVAKSTPPAGLAGAVSAKTEYVDFLAVGEVIDKISSMAEIQKELIGRPTISQLIMLDILKRLGLKQKELAAQLDCTTSFINAVAVGKKALPASRVASLQSFFEKENFDVATALRQEKAISRLTSQLLSLSEEHKAAWLEILP